MNEIEFSFLLQDRIQKIQQINNDYDLEKNAYISFSRGKDSVVLSKLMDIAVPDNQIPRVFINTGIEYKEIVDFVETQVLNDTRFCIIKPLQNITAMLKEYGYPFKSKDHSDKISIYQHSGMSDYIKKYLGVNGKSRFTCPDALKYNFSDDFHLKVSPKCCTKLKKQPAEKWAKENKRPIKITGMRKAEGGARSFKSSCLTFYSKKENSLRMFNPLFVVNDDFEDLFVEKYDVKLCKLYYPPYNFSRTGCKGCPFNPVLQKDLDILAEFLPKERKQCEIIWKPVYEEYRRIGYRLRQEEK